MTKQCTNEQKQPQKQGNEKEIQDKGQNTQIQPMVVSLDIGKDKATNAITHRVIEEKPIFDPWIKASANEKDTFFVLEK